MKNEIPIVWENVFNTSHKIYSLILEACEACNNAGYPYFYWNGWIYNKDGTKTDVPANVLDK